MTRSQRRERWESLFDPAHLALTGVALSAALLSQPHLAGRVAILLAAAAAAWLAGRRLSPLMTVIVIATIVGANLLVPLGKKLASFGPITITEMALMGGLEKAITFEALMFISKACLGPALRLPGRFGAFFSEALRGYDRILERKSSVHMATFFKDVDEILLSVYYECNDDTASRFDELRDSRLAVRRSDALLAMAIVGSTLPLVFH
jgi:hypothetical protein